MIEVPALLGISAAIINIAGLVPYIFDIFRHKTKPERATWWIWSALSIIALTAQFSVGARWSLLMTMAQTLSVLTIAILSLSYGYGTFKKKDFMSLFVAAVGLVLWKLTDEPLAALMIIIGIEALGCILLIQKTWEAPHTETLIAWILATVSACLAVLSVAQFDFQKLIYPTYVLIADIIVLFVIIYRRKVIPNKT